MENPIFSLSAIIGSEIKSTAGTDIAILEDIICNKDNGKITYLILSPHGKEASSEETLLFAVHHSFFYFDTAVESLTFNAKIGKADHSFFLDLPGQYGDTEVEDVSSFSRYLSTYSAVAGHRSDND
ncbi:sporulation protein YlmC with PRC-barrel domain [Lewinella aquimaris]|uniref:Sporulation protein YlmC with PRC-barrel domain n=1 Tax=Neolewinella aquimaris TaxID=1835722 RepID=A0A840E5R4_9BACT|nr:PRC-barrel domain-containing protein [Neolewinella aquimaris]MBB4079052.1 sporulation protein YlmC with PRC-barrel domain [Neolewinella aquimaris]